MILGITGRSISGSSLVGRGSSISRSSFVGRGSSIPRVLHISNIPAVGIIDPVVDGLGPAIRESNGVGTRGGVVVTVLLSIEVGSRVVIRDTVVVGVVGRLIV